MMKKKCSGMAIDNNGYLKVFTNEELMATDWEILDWETLNA